MKKQSDHLFNRVIKGLTEAKANEELMAQKTKSADDMQEGWESLVIDEKERNKKMMKDKKNKKDKSEVSDMFLDYVHGKKSLTIENIEKQWKHNQASTEDEAYSMSMSNLRSIARNIMNILSSYQEIDTEKFNEPWLQSKITLCEDYVKTVHDYLLYYQESEEYSEKEDTQEEATMEKNINPPEYNLEQQPDNTLPQASIIAKNTNFDEKIDTDNELPDSKSSNKKLKNN
jgi:hypothetical protein